MKITKRQLRRIIREEKARLMNEVSSADIDPTLEKEIFKMLDAGKNAAYEDTLDRRQAIRLAGEYVDDVRDIKELYPNAYAWWVENYGSYDANEMIEHWMAKNRYSMR